MSTNGHTNGHVDRIVDRDDASRLPPQSLEDELALIGSLLKDPTRIPACREVLPDAAAFWRDDHAERYRVILDLFDRGEEVSRQTVTSELIRRGVIPGTAPDAVLGEALDRVVSPRVAVFHARHILDRFIRRAYLEAHQEGERDALRASSISEMERRHAERLERIRDLSGLPGEEDEWDVGVAPWPDAPGPDLHHGIAWEVVQRMSPHTEADPVAVLAQLLVCFGNIVGRRAHWAVGPTRHHCNLFLCLVGNSSDGGKGTSWDVTRWLMERIDPDWAAPQGRILSGMSSGEGFIMQVRDARAEDPGVEDKRALWMESEFGSTLGKLNMEGNSLSGWLRKAWDSGTMANETRASPLRATGAHVSIIGHVTPRDLEARLNQVEKDNGFANRFLWLCCRQSQDLPHGGRMHTVDWAEPLRVLRDAAQFAREFGDLDRPMTRDAAADALWEEAYPSLRHPRPGPLASIVTRGAPLVMRIAAIYALLDEQAVIAERHLRAGLALWRYCEQSAAHIFGGVTASCPDREKLLSALREATARGAVLTSHQIRRQVFQGHKSAARVRALLTDLTREGLVRSEKIPSSGGRPFTVWRAIVGDPAP